MGRKIGPFFYVCKNAALLLVDILIYHTNYVYHAGVQVCKSCPIKKTECTDYKSGDYISKVFYKEILDRAEANRQVFKYLKAVHKRRIRVNRYGQKDWIHYMLFQDR